jgi:hypothetical protein
MRGDRQQVPAGFLSARGRVEGGVRFQIAPTGKASVNADAETFDALLATPCATRAGMFWPPTLFAASSPCPAQTSRPPLAASATSRILRRGTMPRSPAPMPCRVELSPARRRPAPWPTTFSPSAARCPRPSPERRAHRLRDPRRDRGGCTSRPRPRRRPDCFPQSPGRGSRRRVRRHAEPSLGAQKATPRSSCSCTGPTATANSVEQR